LKRSPLKRKTPRRDWSDAEKKRGPCRVCGFQASELAHTIGRAKQDKRIKRKQGDVWVESDVLWINPSSVVPLCTVHHREYDARQLDLLPYLSIAEEVNAVETVGIESAYRRLVPSLFSREER
jgi:hypothetical protein